jgi:hypothetical protein
LAGKGYNLLGRTVNEACSSQASPPFLPNDKSCIFFRSELYTVRWQGQQRKQKKKKENGDDENLVAIALNAHALPHVMLCLSLPQWMVKVNKENPLAR